MEKNYPWNYLKNIYDFDVLDKYMSQTYSHRTYYHYTGLDAIDNILGKHEFWLGPVSNFNDTADKAQFEEPERFYSICFSSGTHENLALWYMYSGIDGQGGRIQLSQDKLFKMAMDGEYSLCRFKDNKIADRIKLNKDETMRFFIRDVLYYDVKQEKDNSLQRIGLKYNNSYHTEFPADEFKKYKETHVGFLKDIVWYYEKETRIVVELIGKAAEIVQSDKENSYRVILCFNDNIYNNIRLGFAPELKEKNLESALSGRDEIKRFIIKSSKADYSSFAGKIHMRLCNNCAYNNKKQQEGRT